MSKAGLLVLDDPDHVVDEADVVEPAGVDLEVVEIIEVVVLLHLPELVAQACAEAWPVVEDDGLPRRHDRVPFRPARTEPDVLRRIAEGYALEKVEKIVAKISGREDLLDEVAVVLIGAGEVAGREVGGDVPRDDVAVAGVVLRYFPDVRDQLADGLVRSVADTVVVGPIGQSPLGRR